ncbi:methylmalonate-semialdehyde dehydrogenase, partial [Cystoisospora suis]
ARSFRHVTRLGTRGSRLQDSELPAYPAVFGQAQGAEPSFRIVLLLPKRLSHSVSTAYERSYDVPRSRLPALVLTPGVCSSLQGSPDNRLRLPFLGARESFISPSPQRFAGARLRAYGKLYPLRGSSSASPCTSSPAPAPGFALAQPMFRDEAFCRADRGRNGTLGQRRFATCLTPLVSSFMKDGKVPMFVNNEFVCSKTNIAQDQAAHLIHCPATNDLLAVNPQPSEEEISRAIQSCATAFPEWQRLPLSERKKYFVSFLNVLEKGKEELAAIITREQGKTLSDARGEVRRGIEAVQEALSASSYLMGETMGNVSKGVDCFTYKVPLGVCCGITPFNFPAMVPLWMFPVACLAGNTFLLKPSEQTPLATMKIMSFIQEAGWPRGVVNVVHGDQRTVDLLCTHPTVAAVSFVGGDGAGKRVYELCATSGKRAQCNMGAKNHAVVMPDANKDQALDGVVGAAFGAAGQRCMTVAVALLVGEAGNWLDDLLLRAIGWGWDPDVDVGPVISKEAKKRVKEAVKKSVQEGAKIVLDGLHPVVEGGHANGNFIGPTVLKLPHFDITAYKEELFGPVLCVKRVKNLEEATEIINKNRYGNGTTIFTQSGSAARRFVQSVKVGQVGINVPMPLPTSTFSFTGWNDSMLGALHLNGRMGLEFFTKTKTVSAAWDPDMQRKSGISF